LRLSRHWVISHCNGDLLISIFCRGDIAIPVVPPL